MLQARTDQRSTLSAIARLALLLLLLALSLGPAVAQAAPPPELVLQDPSFSPIVPYNDGPATNSAVASLGATKFVVVFTDSGNSGYGTAVVGEFSGGTVTYGSEYVFNARTTNMVAVSALTVGKIVVVYRDSANSDYGTAVVGDVSGTVITFGTPEVFNEADTAHPDVERLLVDKFVVVYQDAGNGAQGTAIIGTIDASNNITFGGEYVFNPAATGSVSVAESFYLGSKFLVAFRDNGNSDRGTAIVGDVGGNGYLITYGSEYVFNFATTGYVSVASLDSWNFLIAFQDQANSSHGTAVVAQVSGNAISYGSEYVFNPSGTVLYPAGGVGRLSDTRFVVGYENGLDSDGRVRVGDVTGTTISYGNQASFNAGSDSANVAVAGFGGKIAIGWRDESDSGTGKSRVGAGLDPTAVQVASFRAGSAWAPTLALAGVFVLGVGGAAWAITRRRRTL
jgi:hypothetical protein